jgi:glutamine phosphoribosylpyrophosphate amidotransferase
MMRLLRLSLVATAGLSIAAVAAIAAPEHERLRGTVSAVSTNELTVRTATGEVSMSLGDDTKYLTAARSDLNHIATDGYVGVAAKNVGDKLVALDVLIFPLSMKGAAEGHFDYDRIPDTTLAGGEHTASSMTNGSVAAVAQGGAAATANSTMTNGSVAAASERGGARQLTVTYKGGEEMILVPPTAPVVTLQIGAVTDIKPGDAVFVNAVADGGKTTAGLIIVGGAGVLPPI